MVDVKWDWADTKVHPSVRYPSDWVDGGAEPNEDKQIEIVDSFSPRIVTPKDVNSSLNEGNQGFTSKHPEYYVDITCKPYGAGYELLLGCQLGDRYFDVVLQPLTASDGLENSEVGQPDAAWAPTLEVYRGCKILSLTERYATATAPTVTFSCRALRFVLGEGENAAQFGNSKDGRTKADADIPGLS